MALLNAFLCRRSLAVVLACLLTSAAFAQEKPAPPAAQPCLLNSERGEVPDCLVQTPDGQRTVAGRYRRELKFDRPGLALIRAAEGWMYVNRAGRVVLDNVAVFDGTPDLFRAGLVRIWKDGKYGYADRKGRITIPAVYDGALSFDRDRAEVCRKCVSVCADRQSQSACQYHVFSGGAWFSIDKKGRETAIPARVPERFVAE